MIGISTYVYNVKYYEVYFKDSGNYLSVLSQRILRLDGLERIRI